MSYARPHKPLGEMSIEELLAESARLQVLAASCSRELTLLAEQIRDTLQALERARSKSADGPGGFDSGTASWDVNAPPSPAPPSPPA